MTRIQVGAVVRGPGCIVSDEPYDWRHRLVCENGWVFYADPDEDWIDGDGWLILESAYVPEYEDPAPVPWRHKERRAA